MAALPPFDLLHLLQGLPTSPPPGGGLWLNNGALTLAAAPATTGGVVNFSSPSNSGLIAAIIA